MNVNEIEIERERERKKLQLQQIATCSKCVLYRGDCEFKFQMHFMAGGNSLTTGWGGGGTSSVTRDIDLHQKVFV